MCDNAGDDDDDDDRDDAEAEDESQDRDPLFVRACSLKMHWNMSQGPLKCENLQVKSRRPEPGHPLREHAQSKCTGTYHNSHLMREFTGKMPPTKVSQSVAQTLCGPVQSKCTWTSHKSRFPFDAKFTRKSA